MNACKDCGRNLEYLAAPNGGTITVDFCPRFFLVDENGAQAAIEPRKLTTVHGQFINVDQFREMQRAKRPAIQVWVRHVCRPRPTPAGETPAVSEPVEVEPEPVKETQSNLF